MKDFLCRRFLVCFTGFAGHLYGNIPDCDVASKVPMDMVCTRLIQLLQDDDQGVRAKVAKALSYLVMV
jgi:hypothetical protein